MKKKRNFFSLVLDTIYGSLRFPSAWFKLWVVFGYFTKDENGKYQKLFFDKLLSNGFKRTPWQLIFPGQTAGLVKNLNNEKDEQYHIRFYNDGTIDCELEVSRFSGWHWVGPKEYGPHLLKNLINSKGFGFSPKLEQKISKLFGKKPYPFTCMRPVDEEETIQNQESLISNTIEEGE